MKRVMSAWLPLVGVVMLTGAAWGQVELGTALGPTDMELVVYTGRDATLVRQHQQMALAEGMNTVEFRWKDLTIDPTSIILDVGEGAEVTATTFPAGRDRTVVFTVVSEREGVTPVSTSYMTTGFQASTRYRGVLSPDGSTLSLQGLLELRNNTPDPVEDSRMCVVVGSVRLVEDVRQAAERRLIPGGDPPPANPPPPAADPVPPKPPNPWELPALGGLPPIPVTAPKPLQGPAGARPEFWIYSADGPQDLPSGELRRFVFFEAEDVPVRLLYRYNPARWGGAAHRLLSFKNDEASGLGMAPMPAGPMWLLERGLGGLLPLADANVGNATLGANVELDLGAGGGPVIERALMDYEVTGLDFDPSGRVEGYDIHEEYEVALRNPTRLAMAIEVFEEIPGVWSIATGDAFEKKDNNLVIFRVTLEPGAEQILTYRITKRHGSRVRG